MVQFYSCFKFYFLLFWDMVWCMIMSLKQRKIKFKPRIKLKISLSCTSRNKSFSMWNVIQVNCGQKSNVRAVNYFEIALFWFFTFWSFWGQDYPTMSTYDRTIRARVIHWHRPRWGQEGGGGGAGITSSSTTSY